MAYEIRAMSVGEILDQGFRLVRDQFVLLVGFGLTLYLPMSLASTLLIGDPEAAELNPDTALEFAGVALGISLLSLLLSPIVSAAVIHALGERYLGRTTTFGEAIGRAFSIFLPLVGTFLLYTLAVMGGFLLLIIPGIYLMLAFMLVNQVAVLEGRFGTVALRRSRELMQGNLLRGLGVFAVAWVVIIVLSGAAELLFFAFPLLYAVGTAIAQSIGFAFFSAVGVLLYFDLRCRKEAFDLEHLSELVGGAPAEAAAPIG